MVPHEVFETACAHRFARVHGGSGILVAKRSVGEMAYERMGVSDALTFSKGWYSVRDGSCLTVQYYIRGMSG